MIRLAWIAVTTMGLLFALSGGAAAQKKKRPKPESRVITIDALVVEGKIQKPEAFYILQRSNLNVGALELKRSFIPLIVESVKKEPF